MKIFENILSSLGYTRNITTTMQADGGWFTPTGTARVDNRTAMRYTAVFAAIRLRSENIASLPKKVYREVCGDNVVDEKHPASRLIRTAPNKYMNSFTFWEYVNNCLDGWGNAYALIETNGGGMPVALHPVHPSEVMVELMDGVKYFRVTNPSLRGIYEDGEMCHFFSLSEDGVKGVNPITYNAESIGLGMEATRYGNTFFSEGGNVKAVMESEKMLNDKAYQRLKQQKRENHGTIILEDGIKYKTVGIAPEAAQMLQTKLFSIQDVARIFNVPPHMLADLTHANYSTIEQQNILFGQYSLRPAVKRYEVELERKLFHEGDNYNVKFDLRGLMRGDSTSRANYYNTMLQNGVMNRNEVRVAEGYGRVDGLDEFLVALNMGKQNENQNDTEK